ncbi:membrane protein [Candidatus Methylomirabilis lanthanidiphila]|uniref:Membrane protein n=1 Tax=Candidatus Methylomirabilis lanthanidiphila TaxID=2211376 RepID=A0A564ZIE1_9BACT|nr:CPBP family intramembrane metalloprotease [Candidatus Methylomirabilis lanthanidiphila]VUZ84933.1 membrane protein [Candidatus Methylomirabilis lanthanidiphila]
MGIVIVIIGIVVLAVALVAMMRKSAREGAGAWLVEKPLRVWWLPCLMVAYYSVLSVAVDQWDLVLFTRLAAYFGLPTLLLYLTGPKSDDTCTGRDLVINFAIVLWIWLLIELKIVNTNWLRIQIGGTKSTALPLGVYAAIIYALIALSGWRRFDLKCDLAFKKADLLPTAATFGVLGITLLTITLFTGLATLGIAKVVRLNPLGAPLIIAVPVAILVAAPMIFVSIGVVEEILFRGAIQNLLRHRLKPVCALVVASLIFGLAHVNKRALGFDVPNWPYAGVAALAGLGYGFVFWRTNSIIASATVHAMVDAMWVLFLRGGK